MTNGRSPPDNVRGGSLVSICATHEHENGGDTTAADNDVGYKFIQKPGEETAISIKRSPHS